MARETPRKRKSWVVKALELSVITAVAALVLDVLWGVGSRELGRVIDINPSPWTEEVATNLLIWVSLLGAALAYERNDHLGLDFLVQRIDRSARKIVGIFSHGVMIVFGSSTLLYGGSVLVYRTLDSGQVTPALGLKMGYVYLAVPISGLFIVLFGVQHIVNIWFDHEDPFPTHLIEVVEEGVTT